MTQPPAPEFSRLVTVSEVQSSGLFLNIEADADERDKLCQRFDLLGLDSLTAKLKILPAGGLIRLEGSLQAQVTQSCVVTLEPVSNFVEADFSRLYGEGEALQAARDQLAREVDLDVEGEDEPDPIENGVIDVGEAVAEELALSLDPFPRKPGASLENTPWAAKDEGKINPFAVLEKLRGKSDKKV